MKINLVGGGPKDLIPDLQAYHDEETIWVGVDRGVFYLLSQGIQPAEAFGDFDSVTNDELAQIQQDVNHINFYTAEKDEPDMELALQWAIKQNPEHIRIFGGTGGRLDHLFANVQLLIRLELLNSSVEVTIIDVQNELNVRRPGIYTIGKKTEKPYISFLPISSDVRNLSLKGFKYPLIDCHIPLGSTLCISNELLMETGTFSFTEGILMVIRSCD